MANQNAKIDDNNRPSLVGIDETSGERRRILTDSTGAVKVVVDSITATFLDLSDTPNTYLGQAGKTVSVNVAENGLDFTTGGAGGDVAGPASSTDNAITRFDGITGKIIQNSTVIISDAGAVSSATIDGNNNTLTVLSSQISGAIPVANGGTAQTTYTNGQLLIGNTTGNTLTKATITAGAGLSVTNGTGSITVAGLASSDTVVGVSEMATTAETSTGTDATRAVTPDGLAGSTFGTRIVQLQVIGGTTALAVGDATGGARLFIPLELNGYDLVSVAAAVTTAGTTGTTDIQIANVTTAVDMLSTKITIDSTEKTSYTAATAPVINVANDSVATGNEIRFDVDAISTTPPLGLNIILGFRLP